MTKRSEYDPPNGRRDETASERLHNFYRSGDESGSTKDDDGCTFNGLLPGREDHT